MVGWDPPRDAEGADRELAGPLPIIYQHSRQPGDVPGYWRLANVTRIYRNGQKEDPGN